ncbi:glycosyltransferase [Fusobacterium animalis]|uniref:glycosyltransferase n=1 Tax=Fusobacterium animalis TaxID=76859 RepID=UPI00325222D0
MDTYKEKIKLAVVAPPFSGHLYPILELALPLLKEKDKYDICVYTGFQKEEVVKKLGFSVKVLLRDKPTAFEKISDTDRQTNPLIAYKQFKENMRLMPEVIKEIEDFFTENSPDIVLADFIAVPVGFVCRKFNIPWITSIPTPFAIENKTTTPAYLGGLYPRNNFFFKLRDKLARSLVRNFKRLVCFILRKQLKELNFTLYNEKGEENIYSPYSILSLGMKELEFRDDFPSQFLWAGPCCSSLFKDSVRFEANKNFEKTIFLTNGTHLKWAKKLIIDIAKELSQKYPQYLFVVSLGSYLERKKEIIKKNNLYIYRYLDYDEILPKADYIIHHGGAGILYSCVKYNKPAVIIPHDYDQFDYGVRADLAEIAVVARLKSRKSILNAFNKMLQKEKWDNLKKLSKIFNNYLPSELLKKEIDRILKGGEQ